MDVTQALQSVPPGLSALDAQRHAATGWSRPLLDHEGGCDLSPESGHPGLVSRAGCRRGR